MVGRGGEAAAMGAYDYEYEFELGDGEKVTLRASGMRQARELVNAHMMRLGMVGKWACIVSIRPVAGRG